jgi:hypothetical protein
VLNNKFEVTYFKLEAYYFKVVVFCFKFEVIYNKIEAENFKNEARCCKFEEIYFKNEAVCFKIVKINYTIVKKIFCANKKASKMKHFSSRETGKRGRCVQTFKWGMSIGIRQKKKLGR